MRQLPFQPLVPIQTELRRLGKVGAEIDEERAEVAVEDVEVVMVGQRRRTDDPRVGLPCASRRFSVRNTLAFSCALPTKSTPSSPLNDAKYCCATSSFRCPFANVTRSIPCVATKCSMVSTNRWLIGATIFVEGTRAPSCGSRNPASSSNWWGPFPNWHEVRRRPHNRVRLEALDPGHPDGDTPDAAPTPGWAHLHPEIVDVGTGFAVLLRGADFTLVYNAGSNDDLARGAGNRMVAYLRQWLRPRRRLTTSSSAIPTATMSSCSPISWRCYTVREVWDAGRVNDICGYRAFLTAVRDEVGLQYHNALQAFGFRDYAFVAKTCYGQALPAEQIRLNQASRINSGDTIPLGLGATMTILHADGANHGSPNENSLVVRVDLGTRGVADGRCGGGGRQRPACLRAQFDRRDSGRLLCQRPRVSGADRRPPREPDLVPPGVPGCCWRIRVRGVFRPDAIRERHPAGCGRNRRAHGERHGVSEWHTGN